MASKVLDRLIRTQRLPSPSATAFRVLSLADKEDVSIGDVADVIAADPAMAARILKYANSPLVAPAQEITTIQQAVMMLGLRAVKITALSFSLVKSQDFSRCPHFDFDLYWAHAAATAAASRTIATAAAPHLREEAFIAGLLARIGRLAFATAIPEEYDRVLAKAGHVMLDGTSDEKAAFDTDHIDVGAELLAHWKLPSVLFEAVRHQGDPDIVPNAEVRHLARSIQLGLRVADVICGLEAKSVTNTHEQLENISLEEIEEHFRQFAGVLNISLEDLPNPEEMEARAQMLMEEMSVATHVENKRIQAQNRELQAQVALDSLTGLGNRKAFNDQLAFELERSIRDGNPLSLLMMDIDHFKKVNDTYGHQSGDAVLQTIAAKMKQFMRQNDFAARFGGDEFALIAGGATRKQGMQLAERLQRVILEESFPSQAGLFRLTVSIGMACVMVPKPGMSPEDLVAVADAQLYEAKQAGRNCCRYAVLKDATAISSPRDNVTTD